MVQRPVLYLGEINDGQHAAWCRKAALFSHLRARWQDLFAAKFDVLLYDLTSMRCAVSAVEKAGLRHVPLAA